LSANPPRHAERLTSARILFSDARHACCGFVAAIIVTGLKLAGVPVPLIDYPLGPFGKGKGPELIHHHPGTRFQQSRRRRPVRLLA
jgi:hypothetical protein